MRAIVVMFDTLNRHHLPPYGCDWTHAPNFSRLAERSVTFDGSYVCSMPCMPARREMHTARPNFLHRSWGPLEPFDDSVFEMLKGHGVHSHLVTDHYHYWEDGGSTYHCRYNTWQSIRGQEGEPWIGQLDDPPMPQTVTPNNARRRQDWINRQHIPCEHQHPQSRTFREGLEFIRRNHAHQDWVLQLETFDPHEPFFSHRQYKDHYAEHYRRYEASGGRSFDWPQYKPVDSETQQEMEHLQYEYASLLAMCDAKLGDVLDEMDRLNLWDDTLLIVMTDHGFLLGEHELMGKVRYPFYEQVAHTPFFVWDPRSGKRGERRSALVQPCLDVPATLLGAFGVAPTADMLGCDLARTIAEDAPVREAGLFGVHGGHVNITDGRYVYMRGAADPEHNGPLYQYTHMPTHMRRPFTPEQMRHVELAEPFGFTKGCPVMKIPSQAAMPGGEPARFDLSTRLYDLEADPHQRQPLADEKLEARLVEQLIELMRACEAPAEQYERLGLAAVGG